MGIMGYPHHEMRSHANPVPPRAELTHLFFEDGLVPKLLEGTLPRLDINHNLVEGTHPQRKT